MKREAWILGLLASIGGSACGGDARPSTGSESHFGRCAVDADCREHGSGLECVEGLCVVTSEVDAAAEGDAAAPADAGEEAPPPLLPGLPPPPLRSAIRTPGGSAELTLVMRGIDLGDRRASDSVEYRGIGFDLDRMSDPAEGTQCALPMWSDGAPDGPAGIDNALGGWFQLVRNLVSSFNSESLEERVTRGGPTFLVFVRDFNGEANDDAVTVAIANTVRFDLFEPGREPVWDGNDVWPVNRSDFEEGAMPATPRYQSDRAYVAQNQLVAHLPRLEWRLEMPLGPTIMPPIDVPLEDVYLACTLVSSASGTSLEGCTLGGSAAADALLQQLSRFPDPLQLDHQPLCTDSTAYPTFKGRLCSLADTLPPYTPSTSECTSLSFGMTFDAVPAFAGEPATPEPLVSRCPSATDPAHDRCAIPLP